MLGCVVALAKEPVMAPGAVGSGDARSSPLDLENAFWECDYAVTTSGLGLGEGAMCADIQDEFKRRKFGGDFDAMLTWWRQNKAERHSAIAERRRQAGNR
jgi:hypothetical protein